MNWVRKMNLIKDVWTKSDYQQYVEYLKKIREEDYRKFHSKLTQTKYEILGVRVPIQRRIAKEIMKGNYVSFLSNCQTMYYEEVNIKGFIIANISNISLLEQYLDNFLLEIDNWAICDGFCNDLKIVSQNKEYFWSKIIHYLQSDYEYIVRVGLVLLLTFYVEDKYIQDILNYINQIKKEEYYINMAIAWLVCECFVKSRDLTLSFLKENELNVFTQNKAISKIRDSYRVSASDKELLVSYRKK